MGPLESADALMDVPEVRTISVPQVDVTGTVGGMGSMPDLRSGMSSAMREHQDARGRAGELEGQYQATQRDIEKLETERSGELAPTRDLAMRMTERDRPDLKTERIPQENPVQIMDPKETKDFFATAMLFSGLLGLASRGDMYDAMNNMTAAMTGYHEGRKEMADREHQNFKTKMQVILDNNKSKIEEFNAIIKKDKEDLEMIRTKLQLMSAKYDDQKGVLLAKKGDLLGLFKHYDSVAKSSGLLAMQYQKQSDAVEKNQEQYDHWQRMDDNAEKRANTMARRVEKSNSAISGGGRGGTGKTPQEQYNGKMEKAFRHLSDKVLQVQLSSTVPDAKSKATLIKKLINDFESEARFIHGEYRGIEGIPESPFSADISAMLSHEIVESKGPGYIDKIMEMMEKAIRLSGESQIEKTPSQTQSALPAAGKPVPNKEDFDHYRTHKTHENRVNFMDHFGIDPEGQ